jgi:hypothetical protein
LGFPQVGICAPAQQRFHQHGGRWAAKHHVTRVEQELDVRMGRFDRTIEVAKLGLYRGGQRVRAPCST